MKCTDMVLGKKTSPDPNTDVIFFAFETHLASSNLHIIFNWIHGRSGSKRKIKLANSLEPF